MNKLTAAELMVIVDTLSHSLRIANYDGFAKESRQTVMQKVIDIMSYIDIDITATKVEPEWNETGDGV